jgi:hypothetical protein
MTAGLLATDPVALGPYRLLGRLGGGGMGQVYLASAPGGGLVAVKVIRPEFAADPEFRMRFAREVANARNVSGMFTAQLVDADAEGPVPWLATAYIAGPPLSAAVRESGPLPVASLLPLATGLVRALIAIHAAGVVHRDLKPSNVLLAADGPRVIDFGISHAVEASTLTQTGAILGSPGYMSPEQAQGLPIGPASDVFSLGAVLAFAAAGAPPFGTGSVPALVYRVVSAVPDLNLVPRELRPTIERCLAKAPGMRPSPAELLAEFGGGTVPADWLPDTVADTLGRYEPSARVGALAAPQAPPAGRPALGGPAQPMPATQTRAPATREPATSAANSPIMAGLPQPGDSPSSAGRHRQPGRPGRFPASVRRGRVVTATLVVAAVAVLLTWLALGTDTFGAHGSGTGASLAGGSDGGTLIPGDPASGTAGTAAGHGSASPSATAGRPSSAVKSPAPTITLSRAPASASVASTPPGTAPAASAPAARPSSPASASPGSAPSPVSSTGPVAATDATTYSCSDYPVGNATSTSASYEWVNNTASSLNVYYVETSFYAGLTGTITADSSTGSTLAVGGVYLVESESGGCLAAVQINGTSGSVTVS